VVADIHISGENARGLERLKDAIDSEIKFVVAIGDITERGSAQEIQRFIDIANTLGVPCFPVIGNHEIYFGNWPVWKEKIGSTRYRIDGDGTTLFILDSANAFLGRDQLDWLQSELQTAQERVFVFSHANIFVEHPLDAQQSTDIRERARLASIMQNRVDIMFTGHVHRQIIKDAGGVRYIVVEAFQRNSAFLRVSVTKTGIEHKLEKLY
jgi:predicted phosphodiesterase